MRASHYYEAPLQIVSDAVWYMLYFWPITLGLFISFLATLVAGLIV